MKPEASASVASCRRRAGKGRAAVWAGPVVLVAVIAACVMPWLGQWLVVMDPIAPARAVVALAGGDPSHRARGAALFYRDGRAPEVWLTQPKGRNPDVPAPFLEEEFNRFVLERNGVPRDAIRVLPERTRNTANEVRIIAAQLKQVGGDVVIIVTSKYHTRRVRELWRATVGDSPRAIVRYPPDDTYDAYRWWQTARGIRRVAHEWLGLIDVWTGFRRWLNPEERGSVGGGRAVGPVAGFF